MAIEIDNAVLLDSATVNTTSSTHACSNLDEKTVFVDVVTSGTATVSIDASPGDGTWYELDSKTYNASASDVFSYSGFFPFMRVDASAMSSATVKATLTGRGLN